MHLDAIRSLVKSELDQIDKKIRNNLESQVPLTTEISHHIYQSGGKRVRPLILLLAAGGNHTNDDHITLAAVIELIHTATLLHDDVVDQSSKRRGQSTANMVWGNAGPVLVGDFLYSRAFQMIVSIGSNKMLGILAEATNIIAEGEVLQLAKKHSPNITEDEYQRIIDAKTAKLFEIAAQLGGAISKVPQEHELALKAYGKHIGTAFQLVDDVLDYRAPAEIMGKNVGDDLAEGKTTLPLLYALQNANQEQKAVIQKAIQEGSLRDLDIIQKAILDTGAIEYAMNRAQNEAKQAKAQLSILPITDYTKALESLADFTIERIC